MRTSPNLMDAYDSMAGWLVRTAMQYQACGCMEAPACVFGFPSRVRQRRPGILHRALAQERAA
jgi:hypothetical protein